MTLAIIESYSDGITSPSEMPLSTRIPGPVGRPRRSTVPGAAAKPRSTSSALTRASIACPRAGGGSPSSRPPAATWICSLTRSRPVTASVTGCSTWRRVLTSRKVSARSCGWYRNSTVPTFRYPAASSRLTAPRRSAILLLRVQCRRRRLLDQLLAAALDRAVAHADGPARAVVVGDHLHLDVARAGHEPLHQHARVTESPPGLVARPLEGRQQLGLGLHDPDPAPAAAAGRLDHEREADRGRVAERVRVGLHRAPAPLGDRYPDLLGEQLGGDLVAEAPHRVGGRADERDADPLAQLGERGVLGDEPPPDPGRVRAALAQRPLELGVVDVGVAGAGAPDHHRLVGLAHEGGPALLERVEGDRADRPATLVVELTGRVDQPSCGLTSVDDGDPAVHRAPTLTLHSPERYGASRT